MNEEFAIQLKTILDQSSIAQVKEQLSQLKDYVGQNVGNATSAAASAKSNMDFSEMEVAVEHAKEIEQILNKIGDLETTLSLAEEIGMSKSEILDMEVEVEKLKNKLASLTRGSGGGVSVVSTMMISVKDNLKQAVKQAGRFALALIGVRGIYGSIRKATSAWLAQNTEIQEKLNGAWYALGSLFAPAIEALVNMFVRLVSLVDALARALGFAGVNMSKYGKAAGGAAKKQKALMSIDEINNIQDQNSGGAGGSNFKLDDIGEKELTKFKLLLALASGIAAALLTWKIASNFMTDLADVVKLSVGIGLAVAGATLFVMSFMDAWNNGISIENLRLMLLGIAGIAVGLAIAFGPVAAAIGVLVGGIALAVLGFKEFITTGQLTEETMTAIILAFGLIGGAIGALIAGPLGAIVGFLIGTVIGYVIPQIIANIDKIKEKLAKAGEWAKTNLINPIKNVINGLLQAAGRGVNKLIDIINNLSIHIPDWVPLVGGRRFPEKPISHVTVPQLETGTNYVPNDMLAMLHQGEAVVPKKFNQNDMYGQVSEEELNLLSSINEQLIELNRKDTTINLDGTNLAERINNKIQDITYRNGERVFAVAR